MKQITDEQFESELDRLVDEDLSKLDILSMPGIYEILREQLHNEVIAACHEANLQDEEPVSE